MLCSPRHLPHEFVIGYLVLLGYQVVVEIGVEQQKCATQHEVRLDHSFWKCAIVIASACVCINQLLIHVRTFVPAALVGLHYSWVGTDVFTAEVL